MTRLVTRSLCRPVLVAGVERPLLILNALLSFLLLAATHFQLPWCLLSVGFFIALQLVLRRVSQHDPQLGALFKRSTRYVWQPYFPAKSHVRMTSVRTIKSISRPR